MNVPKISIITVTFNAENYIEATLKSVAQQTYPNIEYLIIDGGSTDRTLEIIHPYQKYITQVISEPDQGLYDAMNKGLALATGEYVWFINAGDEIYDKQTLTKVLRPKPWADVYYGEAMFHDLNRKPLGLRSEVTPHKLPASLTWQSMKMGMVVCHQSFIVRRAIAPNYDWQTYPYSADIEWVIQCLKRARSVVNTQMILSIYLQGGFSRRHLKNSLKDRYRILKKHFGFFPNLWNHFLIILRSFIFLLKRRKMY
ncbi:MAG: glycosyltransferase [Microscillaceae bacterium]|nr:glycosyltransferase [Microscillaceae bacterium]MDW8459823.1 glycosyltransferase family 2 protein [Cytophagales bacterium]